MTLVGHKIKSCEARIRRVILRRFDHIPTKLIVIHVYRLIYEI